MSVVKDEFIYIHICMYVCMYIGCSEEARAILKNDTPAAAHAQEEMVAGIYIYIHIHAMHMYTHRMEHHGT
jgi:hypothetical protein